MTTATTTDLAERVAALEAEVARLKARLDLAEADGGDLPDPHQAAKWAAEPGQAPVQVSVEAAARVCELGMEREFAQLLAHTQRTVPDLRSIDVTRYDDPDDPGQPRVHLLVCTDAPGTNEDFVSSEWGHWFVRTFRPHVCRWFGVETRYRGEHGR